MKHWICLAGLSAASPAAAQDFDAAAAFGAREYVEQASLSPDGTKLAYVVPLKGQGSGVFVVPLDGSAAPKAIAASDGKPERVSGCRWASNTRLLCTVYGVVRLPEGLIVSTRLTTMDHDGSNMKVLSHTRGTGEQLGYATFGGSVIDWNPGTDGQVMMIRQYVPETTTGTRLAQKQEGLGVDLVDARTLQSRTVELASRDAAEFFTDGKGNVRMMGRVQARDGYTTGVRTYSYRRKGSKAWEALSTVGPDRAGFDPYGIDPALDVAYGLRRVDGRLAAYTRALDGSGAEKLVYAHPQMDVTGFARIGRNGRIIGATYSTDIPSVEYFDPAVSKLVKSLAKALPKLPLIRVVDSSEDENRLLIWAGSDIDPGRYYLFDRTAKTLNEVALARPQLEKAKLAEMRHITYRAADGTMVPAYLTLPTQGSTKGIRAIVLPHGGPGARDDWGFDWLSQYFASQGFAVLQPNFRGSTGYGDAWFQKNGFQSWKTAIGDVNDAGRWLVSEGIADPAKLAIFGWSYGGYAALQSAATEPGLFKRVVAVAPVTDLDRFKSDSAIYSSHREVERFVGSGPHIEQGSPARHAAAIKAPVLIFHGDMDRNVAVGHAQLMHDKLKAAGAKSELVIFPGLDHYLEDSEARTQMLQKSAAFLKAP
ncbi:S9 family peptidase [Sphingomonas sp. BT-65]|uniref:alpha/beta hydrolase family protein n=1 Tax=Sphingomonas sp. BT-65 TaxID=2989821 RepID=UPI002235A729|nr:S9 family peptidase [Sphingomonas sp. BT-65]MCW4462602.1 S9 family peptidase [Sphingomonas sp. BT-65]